jgi:PmbA protein
MSGQDQIGVSQNQLEEVVEQLLQAARKAGATQCEAAASADAGYSVTVRMGELETLEHHADRGLGLTVYFGNRKGSASTSDLRPESIEETVRAACDIARYTAEDPCAGLADADLMAKTWPDLDLDHAWDVDVESAIEMAKRSEDVARQTDVRITNSDGASVNSHRGMRVYGNSHGFLGGYPSSRYSMNCVVVGEQDGTMQRDYWYTVSRLGTELESPEAVGAKAAERVLHRLGPRKVDTAKVPVVIAAETATSLLGHLVGAIRGGALYRKASFLLDHLNKPIFPDWVHVHEQPLIPRALGSAPFDGEGVATQARDLVADGVLQSYVLDSYAARKLGMQTTGNAGGVRNLTIDANAGGLDALLAQMGTGLYVTELMGQGVNIVTGDYSRGVSGFWVEDGQIAFPVSEITVAGNLRDIFANVVAVGSDVDRRGNMQTGSWLLNEVTLAGE